MIESSEARKTRSNAKDQPNDLRQRRSFCSFSAFCSFYESPDDGFWAWDESLWLVPALFHVVVAVAQGCPTALGVTGLTTGAIPDELDQRHLQPARRAQVQVVPAPYFDARPFGVQTFPGFIRLAMAALVLAWKALPIEALGSQLTGKTRRGWTVEDAIAFDPQQARRLDVGQASQERRAGVPAVADNDRMQPARQQQGHHGTQLAGSHLRGQFCRSDARRVQNEGALTGLCGQKHHVTHDPAWAGRVRVLGQISDGNQRAILGGLGLWTVQIAGVHPQKHDFPGCWQWREVHKELAQSVSIDLAVFQRFVQAGPAALKKWRKRQFGEAAGCGF